MNKSRATVICWGDREQRVNAAEELLFVYLATLKTKLALEENDLVRLALRMADWFDPQQSGDTFQLPELDDWADMQLVEESPCQ